MNLTVNGSYQEWGTRIRFPSLCPKITNCDLDRMRMIAKGHDRHDN